MTLLQSQVSNPIAIAAILLTDFNILNQLDSMLRTRDSNERINIHNLIFQCKIDDNTILNIVAADTISNIKTLENLTTIGFVMEQ